MNDINTKIMAGFKDILVMKYDFTESDWEITKKYYSIQFVLSKEHFIKEGQIADTLGFIADGLFRSYYFDEKGNENTLQFYNKGTVIVLPESFNDKLPSNVNIQAYMDSTLITINNKNMTELLKEIPFWQQICREVSDIKNKNLLDRAAQFQTLSAKERYQALCKNFPDILLNVPLGHIASYLGVDIATLSRIRAKR